MKKLSTGAACLFTPAVGSHASLRPAILIVHGWQSGVFTSESYTGLVTQLSEAGYHCLQVSLRGHEETEGDIKTITRADHVRDIDAAFEYLSEQPGVDTENLGAVGVSYGAYILSSMAPQLSSVKLLVLRAPALYPDADWLRPAQDVVSAPNRGVWRDTIHTPQESKALVGLRQFEGHVLIVWSEKDEFMPNSVLTSYLGAYPHATVHMLADAKHVLTDEQRVEYFYITHKWFGDYLPIQHEASAA